MSDPHQDMEQVLRQLGYMDDPEAARTPERFVELLREYAPTGEEPALSSFEVEGAGPVLLKDLPFYSLCVHHLVPFFGTVDVAYAPEKTVGGLSGIARLVKHHAKRPQLQERMAEQIATSIAAALGPSGVIVRVHARQMCMEMRGAECTGTVISEATRGDVQALRSLWS